MRNGGLNIFQRYALEDICSRDSISICSRDSQRCVGISKHHAEATTVGKMGHHRLGLRF